MQPSRNTVKLPTTNNTTPDLWRELHDVAGQFSTVDRVPVVATLRECGNIGIAGPTSASHPLAAATLGQLIGLHSPAELVVSAIEQPLDFREAVDAYFTKPVSLPEVELVCETLLGRDGKRADESAA